MAKLTKQEKKLLKKLLNKVKTQRLRNEADAYLINHKFGKLMAEVESKATTVEKCTEWVKDNLKANPVSIKESKYTRTDGRTLKSKDITFDNGWTFRAGVERFWKVK